MKHIEIKQILIKSKLRAMDKNLDQCISEAYALSVKKSCLVTLHFSGEEYNIYYLDVTSLIVSNTKYKEDK